MPQQEPDYEQQWEDRAETRWLPTEDQLNDRYIRFMAGENR